MSARARAHQHAEYLALDDQRRDHQRAQPRGGQTLREGKGTCIDIRFVHQLSRTQRDRPFWSIGTSNRSATPSFSAKPPARSAERAHGQRLRRGIVQQETAEVDGQIFFEACQHHLKNAGQILALTGGTGDVLQQAQASELRVQLALGLPGSCSSM